MQLVIVRGMAFSLPTAALTSSGIILQADMCMVAVAERDTPRRTRCIYVSTPDTSRPREGTGDSTKA